MKWICFLIAQACFLAWFFTQDKDWLHLGIWNGTCWLVWDAKEDIIKALKR